MLVNPLPASETGSHAVDLDEYRVLFTPVVILDRREISAPARQDKP
jgi:hypothetical protein